MADKYLKETSAIDGYQLEDGSGVYLLEAPPTAQLSGVSLASGLIAAATVLSLMFAGPAVAGGRSVSTGISMVNYATPSKATARVSSGFLEGKVALTGISRSHGQGIGELGEASTSFDMGTGLSAASGLIAPASIKTIPNAGPARAVALLSAAALHSSLVLEGLSHDTGLVQGASISTNFTLGPAIASASARLPNSQLKSALPLDGRSRSHGLVPQANLSHASGPAADLVGLSRNQSRLQSTGIIFVYYAAPSRAAARLTGSLSIAGGPVTSSDGLSRASARLYATGMKEVYFVTPSRVAGRLTSRIQLFYGVSNIRASGRLAPASINISKINAQGISRDSGRLPGATLISKTTPTGISRAEGRSLGPQVSSRVNLTGLNRTVPRFYCAPLEFLPISKIQLIGQSFNISRLTAEAPHVYCAAQACCATAQVSAASLSSQLLLNGRTLQSGRAIASLTFTGPIVISLDGSICAEGRLLGTLTATYAAGPSRIAGRVEAARLLSNLPVQGRTIANGAANAVLQFTGGTTVSLTGLSRDTSRALAELHAAWAAQASRDSSRLFSNLLSLQQLTGISRAEAVVIGAFANPYAASISRATGIIQPAIFTSMLPITSGNIQSHGVMQGFIIIPVDHPKYIFIAKARAFEFDAKGRRFLILAKTRQFVFMA